MWSISIADFTATMPSRFAQRLKNVNGRGERGHNEG